MLPYDLLLLLEAFPHCVTCAMNRLLNCLQKDPAQLPTEIQQTHRHLLGHVQKIVSASEDAPPKTEK